MIPRLNLNQVLYQIQIQDVKGHSSLANWDKQAPPEIKKEETLQPPQNIYQLFLQISKHQ